MKNNEYSLERALNILVVGSGKAGRYHLQALKKIKKVKVVGLMNSGKVDPRELRDLYKINNWVRSFDELENVKHLDGIILAISSENLINVIPSISKLKIPCLIEKPLGINLEQSEKITHYLNLSDDIINYVGYNRRFYSSFLRAQEYIDKLGDPTSIHVDCPEPYYRLLKRGKKIEDVKNRLILNTTHAIDFLTFLMGKPNFIYNLDHNSHRNGYQIDFMSVLKFDNNKTASFISHWSSPGPWILKIYGEDYQIILNLTKNSGEVYSEEFGKTEISSTKDDTLCKPGILLQNYFFLKSIIDQKKAHPNLCDVGEAHLNNKLAVGLSQN